MSDAEERARFLAKRQAHQQDQEERKQERRSREHNEQRQRKAYEAKKCPHCHKTIPEKLMKMVTEAFMYAVPHKDLDCHCARPSLAEQTRKFLFTYRYGNVASITVPGVQFPNGMVALGVRMPVDKEQKQDFQQVFDTMNKFKSVLHSQSTIRDWSIEWVDAPVQGGQQ